MEQELLFDNIVKTHEDSETQKPAESKKADGRGTMPKRRAKAKRQVEDYYSCLGAAEGDPMEVVKQKYLAKIKQCPPEKYPEEFKKIRRAYDTLRDFAARKQYDILRKYGESIEDLLEEASKKRRSMSGINQAITLLNRAVKIDPEHIDARLELAYASLLLGKMLEFEVQFSELRKLVGPEKWPGIWLNKVAMLCELKLFDNALAELRRLNSFYPRAIADEWQLFTNIYGRLSLEKQLLQEIEMKVCAIAAPQSEDIDLYIAWLNIADAFEDKRSLDRAQASFKRFMKIIRQQADISVITSKLTAEYQEQRKKSNFSAARLFVDLALSIDRNNKYLQQYSREMSVIDGLQKEIERGQDDFKLFPLVLLEAMRLFAEEFDCFDDIVDSFTAMMPEAAVHELEEMDEAYGAGIVHLKKRYPLLYRQYQKRWEELFKEKTAGMNREERRGLRF